MTNKIYLVGSLILIVIIGYWYLGKSKPATNISTPARIISADTPNNKQNNGEFLGEKGDLITITNNQIKIPVADFEINKIRYYNSELDKKTLYFMVVKDEKGTYRAAANACEVCFGARKGFRQDEDSIICNNCQKRYALNTLGVVKGGCNPGPISANVKVENNNLIITSTELSQVANLF